jgi:hypothetical protein
MPIIAKDSGGNFLPAPPGTHQAVCVDVIDEGMQPGFEDQKEVHKISLVWQIDETNPETDYRFTVRKWYTLSLNEKSNLSGDLEAWFGRTFTTEERQGGFDVETVVGRGCQLTVAHKITGAGKTRAAVKTVSGLGKGMSPMQPHDYVRVKDRIGA